MNETRLVCEACGNLFSDHEARWHPMDPEEDQIQCPKCGSARVDTYAFDPEAPVEESVKEEER
jgi:DNA-directed RNA polymerase subunit RPC12/RpoP